MAELDPCAFCDIDSLADRTIRIGAHTISILSNPAYRPGHALVIPLRHISRLSELQPAEAIEILQEAGRLEDIHGTDFGAEMHQKIVPEVPKNGVSMRHLHIHVVPKVETDTVFAVPVSFDDFYIPTDEEMKEYLGLLR